MVFLNKVLIAIYANKGAEIVEKKNYQNNIPFQQTCLLKKVKIFMKTNMTILW